jgi:hypothetical protein
MALSYSALAAKADSLITKFGRSMTLTRNDQADPSDPSKPWRGSTGAADVSITVIGVFTDYTKEDVDGTLVRRGDKKVILSASAATTAAGSSNSKVEDYDALVDGGVSWNIVHTTVVEPGDTRIIYELQVRQ